MSLNDSIKGFADAVKETSEFIKLKDAKKSIDQKAELRQKVYEFKKKEQALFSMKSSGRDTSEAENDLKKMFESLKKIPEISRFLDAEKDFSNMMIKVYKAASDNIESGLKQ